MAIKEGVKVNFKELAPKYFMQGYSCSESVAMAAFEMGLVDKRFVSVATSFSGGMSSRCLCGAVAASQMVLGYFHGEFEDDTARNLAKELYERFTAIHKVTCCRVLTKDFADFHSSERKKHCVQMIEDATSILDDMLNRN